MITFHSVKWKNFLSTGNKPTEVILDQHKTTLVTGINGSGKSSLMDAISYGLFNRSFRKINKPLLVNGINKKNLLVEIQFSTNSIHWKVERGIKPAVFRIYKDGQLLEQDAKTRDYQEFLEKQVIKMSFKTFLQIVILGSANWTAFMSLTSADRRRVIEDLLDIEVFSIMNTLLKEKIQLNKEHQYALDKRIAILDNTLELNKQHVQRQQSLQEEQIAAKRETIKEKQDENLGLTNQIGVAQKNVSILQKKIRDLGDIETRLLSKTNDIRVLEEHRKRVQDQIVFYRDNDTCPTCTQEIEADFKKEILATHEAKDKNIDRAIDVMTVKAVEVRLEIVKRDRLNEKLNDEFRNLQDVQVKMDINNRLISSILEDIDGLQNDTSVVIDETETKNKKGKAKLLDVKLSEQRQLHTQASTLLKDDGIKTQIIRQYIPIMNTLINKYLERMDFFCKFEIDENFNEQITTMSNSAFTYESFSQGEKMRVDLAVLFTWREISRMRNTSPCNLLVLDEIMDSSLDTNGTDEFVAIIAQLTGDNNVIIISHKTEQIGEKFDRVLKVEKTNNFSKYVER